MRQKGKALVNTPTHLIVGTAFFGKPDASKVTVAALLGALLPDASLYGMVGWHLLILDTSPEVVFGELYFSAAWTRVFAVDNSFVIWGVLLGLAVYLRSAWAVALTGAAFAHLAMDFPFHAGDGRPQFWPITMWIFDSPVSYWDSRYSGRIVGALELAMSFGLVVWIVRRFGSWWVRITSLVLLALQVMTSGLWRMAF